MDLCANNSNPQNINLSVSRAPHVHIDRTVQMIFRVYRAPHVQLN